MCYSVQTLSGRTPLHQKSSDFFFGAANIRIFPFSAKLFPSCPEDCKSDKGDDQKTFCSSPSGLLNPRRLASAAPIGAFRTSGAVPSGLFSRPHGRGQRGRLRTNILEHHPPSPEDCKSDKALPRGEGMGGGNVDDCVQIYWSIIR